MVLIKRPLAKPVVPAKPPVKPAKTANNGEEQRSTKSVTTRMPPGTLDMLDTCVATYESDRTEVIKRAIRLLHAALSAHNSSVIILDSAGKSKEIHLVIDGVPT